MDTRNANIDELLEQVIRCLTPEAAKRLSELRASTVAQARIDELAAKSSAGAISDIERVEYHACVAAANFFAILQFKARRLAQ